VRRRRRVLLLAATAPAAIRSLRNSKRLKMTISHRIPSPLASAPNRPATATTPMTMATHPRLRGNTGCHTVAIPTARNTIETPVVRTKKSL
jgi:hypothetical protein